MRSLSIFLGTRWAGVLLGGRGRFVDFSKTAPGTRYGEDGLRRYGDDDGGEDHDTRIVCFAHKFSLELKHGNWRTALSHTHTHPNTISSKQRVGAVNRLQATTHLLLAVGGFCVLRQCYNMRPRCANAPPPPSGRAEMFARRNLGMNSQLINNNDEILKWNSSEM